MHALPTDAQLPVSPEALLGRVPQIAYGQQAHDMLRGRRVLVTGGGGSIGSEIVRQLHRLDTEAVYVLDHDESAMHSLQLQLTGNGLLDDDRIILADIRDRLGMMRILNDVRPHIVYHAAAHKHLPLLERHPVEGFKTNVIGTANVVAASVAAGVERLVNISTDKAAQPTSVLGATKRLAELLVSDRAGEGTRVASVRFGNVLGSRGSFLHGLAFQLATGQPVTLTHRDATRYFMTIPEAAGLVIESSVMASDGETYLLDMGEPVRIGDVIDRFVELGGFEQADVRITGLRPGEKLHEVLLDGAEDRVATGHERVFRLNSRHAVPARLTERVNELFELASARRTGELLASIGDLLPTEVAPAVIDLPRPRTELATSEAVGVLA